MEKNVFGLISGGKDSIYNIIKCINNGYKLIAVGHLSPQQKIDDKIEIDSYMYQTVGSELCSSIAECLNVPYITKEIKGTTINKELNYSETKNDEVEDLFELIKEAKEKFPNINAVSSGAILSTYQKNRVENICQRLNLISLSFLWKIDQSVLLNEMINNNMNSILIKVCAMGLDKEDLMKSLKEMKNKLISLKDKYGVNVCGEGGEYESITLDCPIYKKRIVIDKYDIICHSKDIFSPVYYSVIKNWHLENKMK